MPIVMEVSAMFRSLARAAQSGSLYKILWAVCFVWLVFTLDGHTLLAQVIVAGFLAIPLAWLIALPIGWTAVILDEMLSTHRQGSDTTDMPPRRPVP